MSTLPLFTTEARPDPVIACCPVGIRLHAAMGPEGLATASYDSTMAYRYRLSRVWDTSLPRCAFVMLNPSTATELVLDPTVRRVHRSSQSWGPGSFEVLNIFALRSTKPAALYQSPDPVGLGNDEAVLEGCRVADMVVCAWGTHGALGRRGDRVRQLLAEGGIRLQVLRLTVAGHPGHPLYLPRTLQPLTWSGPEVAAPPV